VSDQPATGSRQASIGLLAVTVVLLASGAVGFSAYRLLLQPPSVHTAAAIPAPPAARTPDTGVPAEGPPATSPKVPVELPEIRLPGTDGAVHRLADWKGRPLVINFWATWCEPCRREIPLLKALRREHTADRLEIVGIAVDYPDDVRKYARAHGIDYPLLIGEQGGLEAASAFGMEPALPFSVFADRQGRVVTLRVGELHQDEAELILDRVRDVDAGKLTLPVAREEISEGVRGLRTARAAN
jgi:thiol-disulfide isomerase/thioredoxin